MAVRSRRKKGRARSLAWAEALDLYELHLRARRVGTLTIETYLRDLRRLRGWVGKDLGEVTLDDLRRLQCDLLSGNELAGKSLVPATVQRITAAWRSFFTFLADEGKLEVSPTARLESPRVPPRVPLPHLTDKEVERLLRCGDCTTAVSLRDQALVELLYATGIRREEAVGLDLASLNRVERQITVIGKGEKPRVLPVIRSAWLGLEDYLVAGRPELAGSHPDSHQALFLSTRGGRRMTLKNVGRVVTAYGKRAKIKKRVTPHMLRRTFATALLRNGANLRQIQLLLGHERLDTTAAYLGLDTAELRRAVLLSHPRERIDL